MISMSAPVSDSRRSQLTRTHRHNAGVQHHERQSPAAIQRVLQMEADDGLLLPILQPEIPGNPAVVLVHLAIAFPPVVRPAGDHVEPSGEAPGAEAVNDFVEGCRAGRLENMGQAAAESTLTAIMAREAIYAGKEMNWAEIVKS
jgi:hypothetical protein